LRIEQFQNNGWIEMIFMVMANEYRVDAVPGFDSRQQCVLDFRRHAIIDTEAVPKQRVKQDFGLALLNHGAHIGDVVHARDWIVRCGRARPKAAQKNANDTLMHAGY
jgi:hypothetical protein